MLPSGQKPGKLDIISFVDYSYSEYKSSSLEWVEPQYAQKGTKRQTDDQI